MSQWNLKCFSPNEGVYVMVRKTVVSMGYSRSLYT